MSRLPLVTLLTDFGLRDCYVAQMKGVVLKHCPSCQIVDLSHMVQRHNIAEGAFLLGASVSHFPAGTIHVAVVDPGVGGKRFPIIVVCRGAVLVGPDNGLVTMAAAKLGIRQTYRIRESRLDSGGTSPTFHGRDIFAAAAGMLATGISPESLGTQLKSIVQLKLSEPESSRGQLRCIVLHVDAFGNIITNARNSLKTWFTPGRRLSVYTKGRSMGATWSVTYGDVRPGELAVLRGSQGYLELAVREGNAGELLGVESRDELVISPG